ncbi:SpoIID/LytB domain-containing protein [Geomicrobium sediminis]|uniref:Stage II sporulation protein D n=2 Tax=Geomicrobium TaxID=767528 RepID=A0ABS2P7C2_9BACL|nr:SpoIID/LytB domain-containing protein [Geomicrobium sediminis]MBM7631309.1 stage II sporulation protein D [Geomicrobium sediminis]
MKLRKVTKGILAFLFVLTGFFTFSDFKANAASYDDQVNVRLVVPETFKLTPTGSYRLVNVDNGRSVDYRGSLEFRYSRTSNAIGVRSDLNNSYIYSGRGFRLEERTPSSGNSVVVNQVRVAGAASYTSNTYRGSMSVRVNENDRRPRLHNELGIEDYLKGVVPREAIASWPIEALKAQSVAARNYAKLNMSKGYLVDTTTDQVYAGKTAEHPNTNRAVDETKGRYATHNGNLITAFYHSSSGGYTDDSENVWLNAVPYIRAVEDPYDNNPGNSRHSWTTTMTRSQIGEAVFERGWTATDITIESKSRAGRVQSMTVTGMSPSGRVDTVRIPSANGSADSIRWSLGQSLNSTKFDVEFPDQDARVRLPGGGTSSVELNGAKMALPGEQTITLRSNQMQVRTANSVEVIRPSSDTVVFNGNGWGHGLGMSQWGAATMAQQGYSYTEILQHYYTDIRIERR